MAHEDVVAEEGEAHEEGDAAEQTGVERAVCGWELSREQCGEPRGGEQAEEDEAREGDEVCGVEPAAAEVVDIDVLGAVGGGVDLEQAVCRGTGLEEQVDGCAAAAMGRGFPAGEVEERQGDPLAVVLGVEGEVGAIAVEVLCSVWDGGDGVSCLRGGDGGGEVVEVGAVCVAKDVRATQVFPGECVMADGPVDGEGLASVVKGHGEVVQGEEVARETEEEQGGDEGFPAGSDGVGEVFDASGGGDGDEEGEEAGEPHGGLEGREEGTEEGDGRDLAPGEGARRHKKEECCAEEGE